MKTTRRSFLGSCAAALAFGPPGDADRLGIMCQFEPEEKAARNVLAAARQAGFRRAQIFFAWDRASESFLRALPGWLAAEDVRADVLSAYVNCVSPETVLMNARAGDMDRAIELAPSIGAARLVAWTGGYGRGLMTPDPQNAKSEALDAICRFLEPRLERLEANRLTLALETYITLACPDASVLRRLLDRLPPSVTAVLAPPNLTPVERYSERDAAMREIARVLDGRIGVVHLKDFRLAKDGRSYELPGPLGGEMNYPLFIEQIRRLPADIPWIAEHLAPGDFASARMKMLPLFADATRGNQP
jgi:sugar phosphate isomerase/epimerase